MRIVVIAASGLTQIIAALQRQVSWVVEAILPAQQESSFLAAPVVMLPPAPQPLERTDQIRWRPEQQPSEYG